MQAPRSHTTRSALLVERVGGPLTGLTPQLERLRCEVVRASDARSVAALVRDVRQMSLVVVNGTSIRTDPSQLVRSIKDHHPDIPILWFTEDAESKVPLKVEVIAGELTKIESRVAALVHDGLYSDEFIQEFKSISMATLRDFHLPDNPAGYCIKSSLTKLNEANAFVFFSGRYFAGQVALSATFGDLQQGYCLLFPKDKSPGYDDLEDFLGEAANRLVGRLKQSTERRGLDCSVGPPYFIRGLGAGFRCKAGAPALAMDCSNGNERLQLELCLYRFDNRTRADNSAEDLAVPGELKFL